QGSQDPIRKTNEEMKKKREEGSHMPVDNIDKVRAWPVMLTQLTPAPAFQIDEVAYSSLNFNVQESKKPTSASPSLTASETVYSEVKKK
ncbi:Carcinoembryonic antigen-related cell adhesion molecule 1, partial [Camelus dromedarius]